MVRARAQSASHRRAHRARLTAPHTLALPRRTAPRAQRMRARCVRGYAPPAERPLALRALASLALAQVHWLIDEMIVGGLVVETNPNEVLETIEAQTRLERQQSEVGQAAAAAQQRLDALAGTIRSAARPP